MKVIVLGAAGFIGSNLAIRLAMDDKNDVTLVDQSMEYFKSLQGRLSNVRYIESPMKSKEDFDKLLEGQEVVYHLLSTTIPSTTNVHISAELEANVVMTSRLLDACVQNHVRQVVFMSSGGTVYGATKHTPITETSDTNPISSYGIQKLTIEKLLFLYNYLYNLDYRVIRLANPYGPYQRPNGRLGAVTTFVYKALTESSIEVYGDGSVVRDFIYIDDAVEAILKIADSNTKFKLYNIGSGSGISIKELIDIVADTLDRQIDVKYTSGREADVPVNVLDIARYYEEFGKPQAVSLREGIRRTAAFLEKTLQKAENR